MMSENTIGLEKLYFNWILEHPEQFGKVDPTLFKTDDIRFIYQVIREQYLLSKKKIVPSHQQIIEMVKFSDKDNKLNDNIVKSLLKYDESSIDEEWLIPKFKAWKASNSVKDNVMKSIEMIRKMDITNYDDVSTVINKIKTLFTDIKILDNDDEDVGEDFDDPESHKIKMSNRKMSTGWSTMDKLLGGGWDQSSLIIVMAQTSGGKCCLSDSKITIRNKKTGKIEDIKIGDFFERLKNNSNS